MTFKANAYVFYFFLEVFFNLVDFFFQIRIHTYWEVFGFIPNTFERPPKKCWWASRANTVTKTDTSKPRKKTGRTD